MSPEKVPVYAASMRAKSRYSWHAMTALSLLIATYAIALFFVPQARPPFLRGRTDMLGLAVPLHFAGGGLALAVGAFQLNAALRARRIHWHRILGRIYVVSVLIGGVSGLRLAIASQGGMIAHVGFSALACLWLFTTVRGFLRIRAGDDVSHRAWMIRSYSLTFAAVTLRFYLPLLLAIGIPFGTAYPTIAWLCWVPNILIAEWVFVRAPARVQMAV